MTTKPFDGPEYRRLLAAARRSLERTGGLLDGSVSITSPTDAERKAIIGITGAYRGGGASRLTVRLPDLDAAVAEATGSGLAELLAVVFGAPLRDRPAEQERRATGVDKCVRLLGESYLSSFGWFSSWLAGLRADGTLTRLVNASDIGPALHAVSVLEAMDGREAPVLLQVLAAEVTGDTKALNHPTVLSSLVLRALALRLGVPRPAAAEDRRDLWDEFDVVVDDLASRVLVLGLPGVGEGLGDWLTSAARRGIPFCVTLQQVVSLPVSITEPVVYVCENPAVLRAASGSLGSLSLPLICTEGRPSTAFHRLAAAVVAGGGELRYHGDFDWPGISIATSVMARHGALPWRLGSCDYLAGVRTSAASGEYVPLSGPPLATPWDPSLSSAMAEAGQVVYEESVTDALLADLTGLPLSVMSLQTRVVAAAESALARQKYVAPLDVCVGIGWLHSRNVDLWRQGRAGTLQELLPVHPDRLAEVIEYLNQWAAGKGLTRSEAQYVAATRDRRALRFTDDGQPQAEEAWRTHWVAAGLSAAQEQKIAAVQSAAPDLVVIWPSKEFTCAECGEAGSDLLLMEDAGPLCMTCADLDHLVFLPAGDAALTRRAKKASTLSAVVVSWNKSRKRHERQGLLVEEAAVERAEQECLADADVRLRRRGRDAVRRQQQDVEFTGRFAVEIARLYPGCPSPRAEAIATHAGTRGSGRVGRSAAGRNLDEKAVTLAVIASIRHLDTDYDTLLMSGVPRPDARERIRPAIEAVLAAWSR